jgi:hypothetical protein
VRQRTIFPLRAAFFLIFLEFKDKLRASSLENSFQKQEAMPLMWEYPQREQPSQNEVLLIPAFM